MTKFYTLNNFAYWYCRKNRLWIVQSLYDCTLWFFNNKPAAIAWATIDIAEE